MKATIFFLLISMALKAQVYVQSVPDRGLPNAVKISRNTGSGLPFVVLSPVPVVSGSSFTLSGQSKTSAGVYTAAGVLVRTLWSGVTYAAGTHTPFWDGKDDAGTLVADGAYTIKVVSNNVTYTWEGVIGNTSTNTIGPARHNFTDRIWDMCITGSTAYFAVGYTEGIPSQHKFSTSTPNIPGEIWTSAELASAKLGSRDVCTDGTNVYWASFDAYAPVTCVFATKVADDDEVSFSSGVSYPVTYGRTYPSVIDTINNGPVISGIAVSASYLFVARAANNSVHVLNKTTGALVQSLTYTTPRRMIVDGAGKLWMITGTNTVTKHTINGDGTLTASILSITGTTYPVSISVTPDDATVTIADAGTSMQVKGYSNSTGSSSWTYGTAGGYVNSPAVTDSKLWFGPGKVFAGGDAVDISFIAHQSDASFWIGDGGNQRTIRMNSARTTKLDEIMCLGYHYSTFTDPNDPTRVFSNYLEFDVDYGIALGVGNGSWALVNNWVGDIDITKDDQYYRLKFVTTLSNGRTYATARTASNTLEIVELTSTGLRYTGVAAPGLNYALEANGDLTAITNTDVGQATTWKRQTLTGFNGSNNPTWGALTNIASVPAITAEDPVSHGEGMYRGQQTSTNIITSFKRDTEDGYHLGAVAFGGTDWLWKTSPSTHAQYVGEFPQDGYYDLGNIMQYGGSYVMTLERNIFWGYYGEFWKNSQTNEWLHYFDNGLLVSEFGIDGITAVEISEKAAPEMAGNAKNFTFVKVGSDYYLYHCDESFHSGTHRWKISNLSSIAEHSISITKSGTPTPPALDYTDLMDGLTFNLTVPNNTAGWTKSPTTSDATWIVRTNSFEYHKNLRDVYIESRPPSNGLTRFVKRDLGTNSGLTYWRIQGEIAWPEQEEPGDNFIDVLDAADKVIVRISRPLTSYPTMAIKANSTTIVSETQSELHKIIRKPQPFSITLTGGSIEVDYAAYSTATVGLFDGTATIGNPKTLRMQMFSAATNGSVTSVGNLRFYLTPP